MPPSEPSRPQSGNHDEPEITQEESVPSDGRDTEGEALMKKVRNKKLVESEDPADEGGD